MKLPSRNPHRVVIHIWHFNYLPDLRNVKKGNEELRPLNYFCSCRCALPIKAIFRYIYPLSFRKFVWQSLTERRERSFCFTRICCVPRTAHYREKRP